MERIKIFVDDKVKLPDNKYKSLIAPCIAEVLGTATLIFIGCMGCIVDVYSSQIVQFAPFTFGLAIAMAIQMFGHISGAHFNPSVTIAALIMNKIDWILVPLYFISQLIGVFLGYGLIMLVTPPEFNNNLCLTLVHPLLEDYQGLIIEIIITAMLIIMCCATWDGRLSAQTDSVSIRLGLMLSGVFIATSQFTGSSLNPVRSLVPAIFHNSWKSHWIYWVGPTVGAVLASVTYKYAFFTKS